MNRYNPKIIEPKWQEVWEETGIYKTPDNPGKEKYYCLAMYPYPSGNLHVGHWYNYGPSDTTARFNRMLGKDVLHPMGYDAFGLPAENAAIKNGVPPAKWTRQNIEYMTKQLKTIGTMYDWEKVINVSAPDYYKWTQWLFLKFYEVGLAERQGGLVNWCPKDLTVLANEQVVGEDNVCERCGTPVEKRDLEQWYFKTTDYADRLLDDLEDLDWPERVVTMQKNWIGRSTGVEIDFEIEDSKEKLKIFTTRPDTIYGATFMVISPEHPVLKKIVPDSQKAEVEKYQKEVGGKTNVERLQDEANKTGVFSGAYALNPFNKEKIPIWISDFVLMDYGTGAIMAVPANDERDMEFAKKFDLPVVEIVKDQDKAKEREFGIEGEVINSDKYDGMSSSDMREKIVTDIEKMNIGKEKVNYRLRDWLVSRQRYWGAPIPIVYCDDCGMVTVPEKDLPVILPEDVEFEPSGKSPLEDIPEFVNTTCPDCGKEAKRETDTLDTFVDSSWYFLRYPNTKYDKGAYDPKEVEKWMPVDHYMGGIEHAILHLLYARFITKALHDHHGLPFEEPFMKLSNQGIILGPDGQKMSKSKGNVVDPDDQVASYGADSLRLYLMFMGPWDQGGPYDFGGIAGTRRFIERLWAIVEEFTETKASKNSDPIDETVLLSAVHKTLRKVTKDLENLSFNTAIAAQMELVNTMNKVKEDMSFTDGYKTWKEALETAVRMLAPFAPHVTEEMWHNLGNDESVHLQQWPAWDEELVKEDLVNIVVQVNGKVRANIEFSVDADQKEVEQEAQNQENVNNFMENKKLVKTIFVPNKLINFVVKD